MYKYNITFYNGDILLNEKISKVINYIYESKLDDGKYKFLYNRIAYNKNLSYIKHIERIKDTIIDTPQKKYYTINKLRILEHRKNSYNPFMRKQYTDTRKEMHNKKQRERNFYIKSIDFLYNLDTTLFL